MRTEEEIRDIKTGLEKQFGGAHSSYKTAKSYYDQAMDLGVMPADVELYQPPTAREQVNAAVDHIMGLTETARVIRWSDSDEASKLHTKLENYGNAFLDLMKKTHRNLKRTCVKHGILYGMFAYKYWYEERLGPVSSEYTKNPEGYSKAIKEFDELCERTFPFKFRPVHPSNIMFELSDQPQYVVESFIKKAISIQRDYPEWDIGNYKPFDDVKWWEFWSNEEIAYFADDTIVNIKPNPYGFIPYEIGYAGFGEESADLLPEDLIVSMIAPAYSAYKMEARLKTATQSLLEYEAFGRWVTEQKPGADFVWSATPGEVSQVPRHYNLQNIAPAKVSEDLWKFLAIVKEDTEKVQPSIMSGNWGRGMTSGYMGALSVGQARLRLDALMRSWTDSMSRTLDHIIYLVKNVVQEPVGIIGNVVSGANIITIKPNELKPGIMHFYVSMENETPEDRMQRYQMGMNLQDRQGLSTRTIRHDFYKADPDYEETQCLIEDAMKDPNLRMQLAISIMKSAGMNEVLSMIQSGQTSPASPNIQRRTMREADTGTRNLQREGGSGELGSPVEQQGLEGGGVYG